MIDFDLECDKQSYNIVLGLYSQYLVRYRENPAPHKPKNSMDQMSPINAADNQAGSYPCYTLSDALLLDYPIMAISKGDIFNIGIAYMIVVTTRSIWVIGPKNLHKVISYFDDNFFN